MSETELDIPVNAVMNLFNRADAVFHKKATLIRSSDGANVIKQSVAGEIEIEPGFHAKIWASILVYEFDGIWFPTGIVEITIKTFNEHKFPQKLDISYMFSVKFHINDAPTPNMKINDIVCSGFSKLDRKYNRNMSNKEKMLAEDEMMRIALIMS